MVIIHGRVATGQSLCQPANEQQIGLGQLGEHTVRHLNAVFKSTCWVQGDPTTKSISAVLSLLLL